MRVVGRVAARVPAMDGEVHPADERDAVVDDDDLLVMGRVDRMARVELHAQARMVLPVRPDEERPWGARRVHDRGAPHQDADPQLRPRLDERTQPGPELRRSIGLGIGAEADAPVKSHPRMRTEWRA